jgi:hypothetical protein
MGKQLLSITMITQHLGDLKSDLNLYSAHNNIDIACENNSLTSPVTPSSAIGGA